MDIWTILISVQYEYNPSSYGSLIVNKDAIAIIAFFFITYANLTDRVHRYY